MNFLRKFVLPVAGVAAIAILIAIASPRAAHAVAAALVQIVNTPANAVPATLSPPASQLYRNFCQGQFRGIAASCSLVTVPAGQTLFVETVSLDIAANPGSDLLAVLYGTSTGAVLNVPLYLQSNALTEWFGTVAARVSFLAGETPTCQVRATAPDQHFFSCSVFGYTVAAQ
jgi:hypothetical protein